MRALRAPRYCAWPLALALVAAVNTLAADPRALAVDPPAFPPVLAGTAMQFPRDHGSHSDFRIEWWYVTGWVRTVASGEPLGFQITLFRVRPQIDERNPSTFTPRQILLAHCAIADPAHGQLWQDQRMRRAGLGLAGADPGDLHVWIDDWSLARDPRSPGDDIYRVQASGEQCGLDLTLSATQPPLLNGDSGYSRKGPDPRSASEYYSQPHLRVTGSLRRAQQRDAVQGEAWLDHEWASEYLDPKAAGWDWIGLNLDDGTAVMAFEIRDRQGRRYWAAGSVRDARGRLQALGPDAIEFQPQRRWRSPRSGVQYPIAQRVRIGALELELTPLLDDQEFDARATAGALYWEGAVLVREAGRVRGRGYLELTGYERPLALP